MVLVKADNLDWAGTVDMNRVFQVVSHETSCLLDPGQVS
ncbi:MAG: hypothetical protein QOI38_1658, partial [Sphingomonadales bacterium]|nr:hypothetical protein [Sphingomonadales bacterium]